MKPVQKINKRKIEILWKYYLVFIIAILAFIAVLGKIIYIQFWQGNYWMSLSKKQRIKQQEIETPRGTIYSNNGDILSISLPYFDVYMDLGVKPLHALVSKNSIDKDKKIKMFYLYVDSLAIVLSKINSINSVSFYKQKLLNAYSKKVRYMPLLSNIDYNQYLYLNQFSFVKQGTNKSGIIFQEKNVRKYPYEKLAMRTIGLFRPNSSSVGLEKLYDSILKGRPGKQLVKKIAPNVYVPIGGINIEPERGSDISTTLDMNMQNIVQNVLKKTLQKNDAEWGTVILMEVQTGKIKAMCNLQKGKDNAYHEIYNHAIEYHEPGSTFKLLSMMALLDKHNIDIHKMVNVNYGKLGVGKKDTIYDSEVHVNQSLSVEDVFCLSSNVGIARLTKEYFGKNPKQYIDYLLQLKINNNIGLLPGERSSFIKMPTDSS
ncbi:MAG: penicillin-binding transpeptidase domain-containing protein, partial [Chitinophagaceae bacterium]